MKKPKLSLSTQNKFILLGLVMSTLLIVMVAIFAISNIQKKLDASYREFAQIVTKTLSIESLEVAKDVDNSEKIDTLRAHTASIISSDQDISFIEFKDKENNIIYSTKNDYPQKAKQTKISISSPLVLVNENGSEVVGSVSVGLAGKGIKAISKATRNSLFGIFSIAWVLFSIVILINTLLITRELGILHHGVKQISTGQFGYKLETKGVSGEVKELITAFNDMSSRLHLYEEQNIDQLTLERNKLEAVLMSIVNGVVVCDNFDNVVLVNSAALKMLAIEDSQILNTKIQMYCDSNGEMCFQEKIEQFKDTPLDIMENKPLEFNIEVDKNVIKAIISPMFSKNQDYVGYIIVLIDVTKEVEINKLKNNFISNVSHELRTPVTVLRTYIDTLYSHGDEFDKETQKEFMETINKEATRLQKMVNEILDFSRLESPNINVPKEYADIVPLIEQVISSMKVLASEKGITFSIIKEPDLPKLPINTESIERAFKNLVSNAIKYSPDNSKVKIRAEIARDPSFVEITVEDQGIGIPEEHQKKIFERFYRVENATHTIKGTGLGLHLVKITIEKHHHGKVFVKSTPGVGSTFGIRLPIKMTEEDKELSEQNKENKEQSL
ncbi:MAG: ATP-binding protein [Candidatus Gastranaerophilales bacterium]|nr:ATP-binding protein [Candidatus Gastranaerophilales bacterium]